MSEQSEASEASKAKQSKTSKKEIVILESPYSGNIEKNIRYAQLAMKHARKQHNEIVIVPHLMWTQHHLADNYFVRDNDPKYNVLGREESLNDIEALRDMADKVVFYVDNGYSSGMKQALEYCKRTGKPFEERWILIGF